MTRISDTAYTAGGKFTAAYEVQERAESLRSAHMTATIRDASKFLIYSDVPGVLSQVSDRFEEMNDYVREKNGFVRKCVKQTRIITAITLPLALHSLYVSGKEIIQHKINLASSVNFAQSLGWVATSVRGVFTVLGNHPTVLKVASVAVPVMNVVSIGVQIINCSWSLYQMNRHIEKLVNFDKTINSDNDLNEIFDIDQKTVDAKMSMDPEGTKSVLKGRLTSKINSHKVAVLTAVISMVAFAIVFIPGANIAALVLGFVGTGICIVALAYEMNEKHKFEKHFEINQDTFEYKMMSAFEEAIAKGKKV